MFSLASWHARVHAVSLEQAPRCSFLASARNVAAAVCVPSAPSRERTRASSWLYSAQLMPVSVNVDSGDVGTEAVNVDADDVGTDGRDKGLRLQDLMLTSSPSKS